MEGGRSPATTRLYWFRVMAFSLNFFVALVAVLGNQAVAAQIFAGAFILINFFFEKNLLLFCRFVKCVFKKTVKNVGLFVEGLFFYWY